MTTKLQKFIKDDDIRLEKLIDENPVELSVMAVADFLHMTTDSVRSVLEGESFGLTWKKPGASKRGYAIPTALFVRWYLKN